MKAYKGIEAKRWTLLGLFREHQNRFSELVNKGHFSVRTLERYETSFNHLTEYLAKEYKSTDLDANAIDLRFVTGFEHFLKVSKDCEHNSAMKHMKGLRKIVLHAVHEDIIHKDPFHYYRIREKPVEKDFLNQTEIDLIYNKDIPNKRLVTIRDMFIFQCYTGMAYCDILALAPEHIVPGDDGRLWIIKPREKTRNIFRIPLLPRAEEILLRYSSDDHSTKKTLLPVSSNQKMNAYLKELGVICGIEKNLTTHLGRHTFATTVTLNNRITKAVLQKMMGVTKASTIEIYAKMLDSTISEEMEGLRERLGN
jgi:site-specific recombinase XerD